MTSPNLPQTQPRYFEILRALQKGGMSLWLNRKSLMPMTLVPVIVTFLTLMIMRTLTGDENADISYFVMAMVQIPADFVVGIFCALVVFIIMSAPKKDDKDKPVMFTLNILERKDLILAGAIAHVVISYLSGGFYGGLLLIFEPMQQAAAETQQVSGASMFLLGTLMAVFFYAIRFLMLPILVVAQMDIKGFYRAHMGYGLSLPVFLVKAATAMVVGFFIMFPAAAVMGTEGDATPIQMALVDFAVAFGNVIAVAWAYAALAIGLRQMTDKGQS